MTLKAYKEKIAKGTIFLVEIIVCPFLCSKEEVNMLPLVLICMSQIYCILVHIFPSME